MATNTDMPLDTIERDVPVKFQRDLLDTCARETQDDFWIAEFHRWAIRAIARAVPAEHVIYEASRGTVTLNCLPDEARPLSSEQADLAACESYSSDTLTGLLRWAAHVGSEERATAAAGVQRLMSTRYRAQVNYDLGGLLFLRERFLDAAPRFAECRALLDAASVDGVAAFTGDVARMRLDALESACAAVAPYTPSTDAAQMPLASALRVQQACARGDTKALLDVLLADCLRPSLPVPLRESLEDVPELRTVRGEVAALNVLRAALEGDAVAMSSLSRTSAWDQHVVSSMLSRLDDATVDGEPTRVAALQRLRRQLDALRSAADSADSSQQSKGSKRKRAGDEAEEVLGAGHALLETREPSVLERLASEFPAAKRRCLGHPPIDAGKPGTVDAVAVARDRAQALSSAGFVGASRALYRVAGSTPAVFYGRLVADIAALEGGADEEARAAPSGLGVVDAMDLETAEGSQDTVVSANSGQAEAAGRTSPVERARTASLGALAGDGDAARPRRLGLLAAPTIQSVCEAAEKGLTIAPPELDVAEHIVAFLVGANKLSDLRSYIDKLQDRAKRGGGEWRRHSALCEVASLFANILDTCERIKSGMFEAAAMLRQLLVQLASVATADESSTAEAAPGAVVPLLWSAASGILFHLKQARPLRKLACALIGIGVVPRGRLKQGRQDEHYERCYGSLWGQLQQQRAKLPKQAHVASALGLLRETLRRLGALEPRRSEWQLEIADTCLELEQHRPALKAYIRAGALATAFFCHREKKGDVALDPFSVRGLITCCVSLKAITQAAVLCQCVEPPDYTLAFKLLQENTASIDPSYFRYCWETPILEILVYIFAARKDAKRTGTLARLIAQPELNQFNVPRVRASFCAQTEAALYRTLAREFLL